MYFKDIIGQEEVKSHLRHSAQTGVVPHAQLFVEKGGTGAFALALAYARYLNCTDRTATDACGHCSSCLKYNELSHLDLHFVFPMVRNKEKKKMVCDDYLSEWRSFLSKNTYFGLNDWLDYLGVGNSQAIIYAEESNQIIRKMSLKVFEAKYRILLVWLPEKMQPACANKLLKFVEEPPANTVILMISEDPGSILGTILSRVQQINVPPILPADLEQFLQAELQLSSDDAKSISHLAEGNYLKAIEAVSTNEDNLYFLEQFKTIMRNSWARNVKGMKEQAEELAALGREKQKHFLSYCQRLIRENYIYRFRDPSLNYMNRDESAFSVRFSPFVNEANVIDLMSELSRAEADITQNVNAKMVFFDLALKITVLIKKR